MWWLGSPVPPGCWCTPSCCKQVGRKEALQVGRVFFLLLYYFILKPKAASLGVEAAAAAPHPRREGWMCPQPQATEESLGQGEMTPKPLQMMKHLDSF